MFSRKSNRQAVAKSVLVNERTLSCLICKRTQFFQREVQLNTMGMTFLDLDWLNRSADGAVCTGCGYVHLFFGDMHQWVSAR